MTTYRKNYIIAAVLLLVLVLSGGRRCKAEEQAAEKRVLFISSYSYAWETVPQQIDGIEEAFGDEVTVDYKFMDTKNVTSEESAELFLRSMEQYLLEVKPYDGVIVGDDAAFQFALEYREELFPGIPITYEGVNNVELALEESKDPLITGVVESLSYENTLRLATQLYPKATKLVAVLDQSVSGKSERRAFYSHAKEFPGIEFAEIDASEYTRQELAKKVASLTQDTILLYIICSMDAEGTVYTSEDSVSLISSNANIPVFSIVSNGMGCGILGGELLSQKQMGYLAAEMLRQYFSGEDLAQMDPTSDSARQFCFDEDVMRRFDLNASQFPKGSKFFNHRETFLERNLQMIWIALFVGTFLVLLVIVLSLDNMRRRRLNEDLRNIKDNLEFVVKYDTLTKLKNRRVFMEELQRKIEREERFGLLLFDIDNFKRVNDSLGHNNGDVVLREMADRTGQLEDVIFKVYRLAGDEFTAIVSTDNVKMIREYAKAVKETFVHPFVLENQEYFLHASIGIAMYPKDGSTPQEMVSAADAALYHVKNNGKNNFAFYDNTNGKECNH